MTYRILELTQLLSGKWQVRAELAAGESAFFTFLSAPSQAQVDIEAEALLLSRRLAQLRDQPPPLGESATLPHRLSKLDYMNRFTDGELAGIYLAAKQSVAVEVWLEKFRLAADIDLKDPRTVAGLMALEAAGLLAPGRAQEILT